MSTSIRKFWKFIKKNETARGLLLVGIVILGSLAVWGGVRLALSTDYPVLVVSSVSLCPPTQSVLTIDLGSLLSIRDLRLSWVGSNIGLNDRSFRLRLFRGLDHLKREQCNDENHND